MGMCRSTRRAVEATLLILTTGVVPSRLRGAWMLVALSGLGLGAASPAAADPQPLGSPVVIQGGRITSRFESVSLPAAWAALARAVPGQLSLRGALTSEPVSLALHDATIDEAIGRLLRGRSFLVRHEGASSRGDRRIEVVVLPDAISAPDGTRLGITTAFPQTGRLRDRRPAAALGARPDLGDDLEHAWRLGVDPAERARAPMATRDASPSREAWGLLVSALDDPDELVRRTALEQMGDAGQPLPLTRLIRVSREDQHATIRVQALALLAERAPDVAVGLLRHALDDSDSEVRERSRQVLEDLGDPAGTEASTSQESWNVPHPAVGRQPVR